MRTENRRYTRLVAPDNAFAALGRECVRVGNIQDISLGGVAFTYLLNQQQGVDAEELTIFLSGQPVCLRHLPCGLVYDRPASRPFLATAPIQPPPVRRCAVCFRELSADQRGCIEFFIKSYVIPSVVAN